MSCRPGPVVAAPAGHSVLAGHIAEVHRRDFLEVRGSGWIDRGCLSARHAQYNDREGDGVRRRQLPPPERRLPIAAGRSPFPEDPGEDVLAPSDRFNMRG